MTGQILVVQKSDDRLEQIIPYIERVAQPGMRVVFLMRYPVNGGLGWFRDHWVTTESLKEARSEARKIAERYSLEEQNRLAQKKVFLAQEALRNRGVEIMVEVYTGSLRRVIEDYMANGEVHLIMMRATSRVRIMSLLRGMTPFSRLFKRPSSLPVLLLHPHPGT